MSKRLIAPGPRGHVFWGTLKEFKSNLINLLDTLPNKHGDIVRIRLGPVKVGHILAHPAMAEQALISDKENIVKYSQVRPKTGLAVIMGKGLIMSYGPLWKKQRDLMKPVFHPRRVAALGESMINCGKQLIKELKSRDNQFAPIDIKQESMRLAFRTAMATLFGTVADDKIEEINNAFSITLRYAYESMQSPWTPPLTWPTKRNKEFLSAVAVIDNFVNGLIKERLLQKNETSSEENESPDLLSLLLEIKDESNQTMDLNQIRDEAVTMLIAGYETSAAGLLFACYELAKKPEIAQRVRDEIEEIVGDRDITISDIKRLTYLDAVVRETLRLCPPVPVIPRAVLEDTTINGFHIPAKSMLFISVHNIHRHKHYWDNPESFDPERFVRKEKPKHRCQFLPFGSGPRLCIGQEFAYLELATFLAQLVSTMSIDLISKEPLQLDVAVTTRPKNALYMQFIPLPDKAKTERTVGAASTRTY